MGTALARVNQGVGDAGSLLAYQRDQLVAFMTGLLASIDNMMSMFRTDSATLEGPQAAAAQRILARAASLKGNIIHLVSALSEVPALTEAWFKAQVEDGREIVRLTEVLSADMVGLLSDGTVPSEDEARKEMFAFGLSFATVAGLAYYFWWTAEKEAEAEQEKMLASGEIEDCGCGG